MAPNSSAAARSAHSAKRCSLAQLQMNGLSTSINLAAICIAHEGSRCCYTSTVASQHHDSMHSCIQNARPSTDQHADHSAADPGTQQAWALGHVAEGQNRTCKGTKGRRSMSTEVST